jgi:2-polyprenyl-3-methyl-5-hydroxy-6-metoxy-1,4-benzoquinol methylase
MRSDIYETYADFLSGKRLDVGRRFHNLSMPTIADRIEYLRRRCTGKKVLHIGCLDHPEVILERIKNETWLHGIISEVSEQCIGIDINDTSYHIVHRELCIDNIQLIDLSKSLKENDVSHLRKVKWDLILCAEILEHVTNHQQLLQNLHSLSQFNTMIIITGPNAFGFENFINTLRGFETVNSDHKYWFTFYTMSRMLVANGWKPHRLIYYDHPKGKLWLRLLCQLAIRISRAFSEGLIIEANRLDK